MLDSLQKFWDGLKSGNKYEQPSLQTNGFKLTQCVEFHFIGGGRTFFFGSWNCAVNVFFLSRNVTWCNCCAPRMSDLIQQRQKSPWLWPNLAYKLFKEGREHDRNLKILHNFTDTVWILFLYFCFLMVHSSCLSEVLRSVESFQMGVRFSPIGMHLLRGELSLWDSKESPEKKTTADWNSVIFKQGCVLLQGSNKIYRSLTAETDNRD